MNALGIIVDNFAGGGGASTGIEAALGRSVDLAINHDEQAIRMHEANHPGTRHIRNNIWQIDPREVTAGRHVQLAWFSPDCKHFSKAKGGKPREKSIRDLAWVVVLWAQRVKPDVILLENVEEFRTWGPLDGEGQPIKERAGETFDKWQRELRKAGYKIQWKELRACDYGAPTIRKRFFMIARADGKPIVWPAPTHGKPDSAEVKSGKLKPWRTAAEIIDWSIPCPSIFDRKKPLAEKTLRRIAHGIMKFVVNNPAPFIVPLTHYGSDMRSYGLSDPLHTVTGANRGEMALVSPYFARTAHGDMDRNGKRRGQPCHGPEDPFPTVTQSGDSALIVPHITKFRAGAIGHGVDEPLHTVTANSFVKRPGGSAPLGVVAAAIAPFATYAQQGGGNRSVDDPHHTVTASNKDQNCVVQAVMSPAIVGCGGRRGQSGPVGPLQPFPTVTTKADACAVTAFMQKFAENGKGVDPTEPLHTVMAGAPRHAVVCAHLEQANGGPNNENLAGRAADDPLSTVATSGSQQRLVTSNLIKLRGTSDQHVENSGAAVEEPLGTISAGGIHAAEVRAFLIKYYGNEQDGHGLSSPLGTVTVQDRFGLVTVMVEGEEYVIVDIGMRMLTPRELFNAQGFPPDYIIEQDAQGLPITKSAQVAKCGNSVCPPIAEALVRAQFPAIAAAAQVAA
ncbi:DNA cytosine methyltransferase [Sphingobium sp. JS3065]|uniref:DNA cytosine methyltransferase n=1 Tax=Sphingobium sp. JS3065 TaxID=2970925 RepID=UPI002263CC48|nr:DNA cytosine methyltransferase [Sphingobium sp. JS3065]UZW55532.1 DNA cytosine methyltransferase [Sphingobium sp. JS3065]